MVDNRIKTAIGSHTKNLEPLVGKKVVQILIDDHEDTIQDFGYPIFGLRFDDGHVAWIMSDEEGNGPGCLHIEKSSVT